MIESLILDWLNLFFRWFHVIAAIAWIGASFYFVWLDTSLSPAPAAKQAQNIRGELWAFHGGGIYEVNKYHSKPETMPANLHWFKWEAYATWLTGILLMSVLYYSQARLYLLDETSWLPGPAAAIAFSVSFLAIGVALYECLFKALVDKHTPSLVAGIVLLCLAACFIADASFSGRAAYLHVGALLASIMAGNVFFGIIPAQKRYIAELERNPEPDLQGMLRARQRSLFNNYFTLPVIFCMISNHYAALYNHELSVFALIAILSLTAYARHFFNLRNAGHTRPHILIVSVCGLILLATLLAAYPHLKAAPSETLESEEDNAAESIPSAIETPDPYAHIEQLVRTHCATCHSASPTQPGFLAAPAGLLFENADQLKAGAARSLPAVASGYMPLGNITGLSKQERQALVQFLEASP